jgi:hypothetical protein
MAFATLAGGDTVSFDLSATQAAKVQAAVNFLTSSRHFTKDAIFHYGSGPVPTNPAIENVIIADGGANITSAPNYTDAIVIDSVNGTAATKITVSNVPLIVGNQGNDSITLNNSFGGPGGTIIAGDGNNVLTLGALFANGASSISAGNGNNSVGLLGNGTVQAGDGRDTVVLLDLSGKGSQVTLGNGSGDQVSFGGLNGKVIVGNGSNDSVTFVGSGTVVAGNGSGDTVNFLGQGLVSVGSGAGDVINFDGSGTIDAGGADRINITGGGAVSVQAGPGNDTITLGQGYDSVVVTSAATVYGGMSDGEHDSSEPHSTVYGGSGNFLFIGSSGFDSVVAGSGNASLQAGVGGHDTFVAGSGHDTLDGSANQTGQNVFFGGSGLATMTGSTNGTNTFHGGSGQDTINVSGTHNLFVFDNHVSGNHVINGVTSNNSGTLEFDNYGLTPQQIVQDSSVVSGSTVIHVGSTTVTLKNFTHLTNSMITTKH